MNSFTISWPSLNLEVSCEPIADNKNVYDLFCENLPIKALQGHEVSGGYCLRNRCIHLDKKPYEITDAKKASMKDADEGTVFLFCPQGSTGELVVKYGESVDPTQFIPFAKVTAGSMEALKKAGKAAWKSASRTKDVIVTEIKGA